MKDVAKKQQIIPRKESEKIWEKVWKFFLYSVNHYCLWLLKVIQGAEYFNLKYSLSRSVESSSSCRLKETHEGKYFELKYLCVFHLGPEPFILMPLQQNMVNLRPKSKFPENRHKKAKRIRKNRQKCRQITECQSIWEKKTIAECVVRHILLLVCYISKTKSEEWFGRDRGVEIRYQYLY